jgi:predicted SAM-dependent methyltransferase
MMGKLREFAADPYFKAAVVAITAPLSFLHRKIVVARYLARQTEPKLQLGSGVASLRGWLNSDYRMRRNAVRIHAGKKFPLRSNIMSYVYSEHLFEHLSLKEGTVMLEESFRVLRPRGVMRLVTPDLNFFLSLCEKNLDANRKKFIDMSIESFYSDMPIKTPIVVFNYAFRNWGHQFLYDFDTLKCALERVGFIDVQRREISKSIDPVLQDLESRDQGPMKWLNHMESMVVEAKKP